MKNTVLYALAILNTLLLCSFVARVIPDNTANAQVRRPGEFLLIPGEVTGGNVGIVYVLDQTNQGLGAIAFDENARGLTSMPAIDLTRVFNAAGPR